METEAVEATLTIYLELPKLGFFLGEGWNHVGMLERASFGLPEDLIEAFDAEAHYTPELEPSTYRKFLPKVRRTRHKYEAGYVVALAGSYRMMGAGVMSAYSALRSGAGIVRLFYPRETEGLIQGAPWELIKEPFVDEGNFYAALEKAKALILGPGMGRGKAEEKKCRRALAKTTIPVVIDADALFFLAQSPYMNVPEKSVLTPHLGEMKVLLEAYSFDKDPLLVGCQGIVEKKKVSLLLKGAPNILFSPGKLPTFLPFGNPGMATAGSGDVLSGVIAALLAGGLCPYKSAFLGCYIHGLAGAKAAESKTIYSMTAMDILESLPQAFALLQ